MLASISTEARRTIMDEHSRTVVKLKTVFGHLVHTFFCPFFIWFDVTTNLKCRCQGPFLTTGHGRRNKSERTRFFIYIFYFFIALNWDASMFCEVHHQAHLPITYSVKSLGH